MSTESTSTTRRSLDGLSNRERLIRTTSDLISVDGYHHVPLSRILSESGVVRSNFYYHFKTKDDLTLAVIDDWAERIWATIVRPAVGDASRGPADRLRAVCIGLAELLENRGCRGGCPFGSLASAEAEHNESIRRKVAEKLDALTQVFADLLREAQATGELTPSADPDRLATCLATVIQGGAVLSKTYASSDPLRVSVETYLDLALTR